MAPPADRAVNSTTPLATIPCRTTNRPGSPGCTVPIRYCVPDPDA
jgi:hypothetical protein